MVRINHSVTPITAHPITLAYKEMGLWWWGWRLYIDSITWISTHQSRTDYSLYWVPTLPTAMSNTEPPRWHHSPGDQPASPPPALGAGWLHCIASIIEEVALYFYWRRQLFWLWVFHSRLQCFSAKTTIHGQNNLSTAMVSRTALFLTKELSVEKGLYSLTHWSCHVLQYPETTVLQKWWNGLLKTHLWCQLDDNNLWS